MNKFVIFSVLTFSIVLSASEDRINNILNSIGSVDDAAMNQSDAINNSQIQLDQNKPQQIIDDTFLQAYIAK